MKMVKFANIFFILELLEAQPIIRQLKGRNWETLIYCNTFEGNLKKKDFEQSLFTTLIFYQLQIYSKFHNYS